MVTPTGLPVTIRVTAQDANAAKIARRKVRHDPGPWPDTRRDENLPVTDVTRVSVAPATASVVCTLRTIRGKARGASIKPGGVRQYLDAAKRRTRQFRPVSGEMPRSSPTSAGAAAARTPIARHARTMARLPRGSARRSRAVEWRDRALLLCATLLAGAPGMRSAEHGKRCGPKCLACGWATRLGRGRSGGARSTQWVLLDDSGSTRNGTTCSRASKSVRYCEAACCVENGPMRTRNQVPRPGTCASTT